jgi:hypothetical protein
MIIWVFGAPLIGLWMLIKRRHRLETPEVKRYFIVIYQGLKNHTFYWEFVNVFRKILLLSFNVFLSQYSNVYKGGVAVITVIIIYRIHIRIKPYVLDCNNDAELLSIVASGITLAGGLVFSSEDTIALLDLFIFIIILYLNFKFVLLWTYLMSRSFENTVGFARKFSVVLAILLNRSDVNKTELKTPVSTVQSMSMKKRYKKILKQGRKHNIIPKGTSQNYFR